MTARRLVDFHCHLDLYPDHAEAFAACEREEVFTLAVTTTPRAWPRNQTLAAPTTHVRAALGLHPQLVAQYQHEVELWDQYLPQARYIGEVGLDAGPKYFRSLPAQKAVFEHILRACARAGGKILTVHSVRAITPVLDLLEAHLPLQRGRVVLHWFTGTRAEARRAVDLGCWFSVNAEMFRNDRHQKMIAALPADRILTETDGPFTAVGDRPARPADAALALQHLASARGTTVDIMSKMVLSNLRTLTDAVE